MILTRRSFLKIAGTAAASGLIVPAFTLPRDPYVRVGQPVDYIGPAGTGFIGGTTVHAIGEWDSIGYPVTVYDQGFPRRPSPQRLYDFNLCLFRKDVPPDFWHSPSNRAKYPNLHTYVREQRFGETVAQAIKALDFRTVAA